jgi:hypothetical protein
MQTNRLILAALSSLLVLLAQACGSPPVTNTDGGITPSCAAAPAFVQADLVDTAGFDPGTQTSPPYNYASLRHTSATAGRFDVMFNELYVAGPLVNVAIPAKTYQQCEYCYIVTTGCDSMGADCAKGYLAQSGTLSVGSATKVETAGTYAFTLTNVVYKEWDFQNDKAVADGGCLSLPSFSFSGTWP